MKVVVPEYAGLRYHSSSLFFSEPTLYVIACSTNKSSRTVLEEGQYLQLADFVSSPEVKVASIVQAAAVPLEGRRNLSDLEGKFDQMIARHSGNEWQFFEQSLIPELVTHLSNNPALVQRYLEKLSRLSNTVFGEFCVPIGGAGVPDLLSVNKFDLMNRLFGGNAIGEAKCYVKKTLTYRDVITVNGHLDSDPSRADLAVIFVAGDRIASTAWRTVLRFKRNRGSWKVIIVPRYLLIELISECGAITLLDM